MVRVGFIEVRRKPSISKLCLDMSGTSRIDIDVRDAVGVSNLPRTWPDKNDRRRELPLVVPVNVDGSLGHCSHAYFIEDVPTNIIDQGMEAIYMMEELREIYGGKLPVGPWSRKETKDRPKCAAIKLDSCRGYQSPAELGLYESAWLKRFCTEDQFRITQNLNYIACNLKEGVKLRLDMAVSGLDNKDVLLRDIPSTSHTATLETIGGTFAKTDTKLSPATVLTKKSFRVKKGQAAHPDKSKLNPIKPHLCRNGQYMCKCCGQKFNNASNCRKHSKTHLKMSDKMQCTVCGMYVSDPSNFKVHCERHRRDKSYKCSICPQVFSTNKDLNVHKKTHSTDKKKLNTYCVIPDCPKKENLFKDLCRHLKMCHKVQNIKSYKDLLSKYHKNLFVSSSAPCKCEEHDTWIYKWVGKSHNCSLCDCVYVFRHIWDEKNCMQWALRCKYLTLKESLQSSGTISRCSSACVCWQN